MNHTLSDSQLEAMIKSAVNSSGPLPPEEKFSQLVSALRELQERRKAERDSEPVKYNIGEATMRHIFTPTGMTNVSDMQAVFDRVEAVLAGMEQPTPVVMYSEPVVYASEEALAYAAHGELLLRVLSQPAGDAIIPIYRHAQQPVVPDGYVMVPMRLTAENGAKGVLSGEFSETQFVNCPECFGDDECETCDGSGRIEIKVPVSWTTIKEIWIKGVEYFAAAPQENN